jgi:predicted transcriptional regulator
LESIPSFISSKDAIKEDVDRLQAMKKFQESKLALLPVISADGSFKGILQRDILANEILIMLSSTIKN